MGYCIGILLERGQELFQDVGLHVKKSGVSFSGSCASSSIPLYSNSRSTIDVATTIEAMHQLSCPEMAMLPFVTHLMILGLRESADQYRPDRASGVVLEPDGET